MIIGNAADFTKLLISLGLFTTEYCAVDSGPSSSINNLRILCLLSEFSATSLVIPRKWYFSQIATV